MYSSMRSGSISAAVLQHDLLLPREERHIRRALQALHRLGIQAADDVAARRPPSPTGTAHPALASAASAAPGPAAPPASSRSPPAGPAAHRPRHPTPLTCTCLSSPRSGHFLVQGVLHLVALLRQAAGRHADAHVVLVLRLRFLLNQPLFSVVLQASWLSHFSRRLRVSAASSLPDHVAVEDDGREPGRTSPRHRAVSTEILSSRVVSPGFTPYFFSIRPAVRPLP